MLSEATTSRLRFSRAQRLAHAKDIELVKRTGKRVKAGLMDVRIAASPSSCGRVGIIVPKYGRNIIERNLLRRRLRELVRTRMLPLMLPVTGSNVSSSDVLIRTLPRAYSASFKVLSEEIDGIAARVG